MFKIFNLNNTFLKFFFFITVISIPILNVLSNNISTEKIEIYDVGFSFIYLSTIYFIIFFTLKFLFKLNSNKLIISCSLIFYFFFLFKILNSANLKIFLLLKINISDPNLIFFISLTLWFLIASVISILVKYLYNHKFEKAVIFVFFVFLITNVFNIIKFSNLNLSDEDLNQNPFSEKIIDTKFKIKPNVYLIVSDMFAGSEYMSLIYNKYDDHMNKFLISKNFTIKKNHLSNYPNTALSIPSVLNGSYLLDDYFFKKKKYKFDDNSILKINNVDTIFKNNGYNSKYIICNVDTSDIKKFKKFCDEKQNLSFVTGLGVNFIEAIMYHTFLKTYFSGYLDKKKYKNRRYLDNYEDIIKVTNVEKEFKYIHLYFPHPPYVFNEDCSFRNLRSDKIVVNNSLLSEGERLYGFKKNFECSSKIIIKIINEINTKDKNAFFIFISDHGPHLLNTKNVEFSYKDILDMHSTNLSIKFGDNNCKSVYDIKDLSHVNLFRIVFNCIGENKNLYLKNYIYYKDVNYSRYPLRKLSVKNINELKN